MTDMTPRKVAMRILAKKIWRINSIIIPLVFACTAGGADDSLDKVMELLGKKNNAPEVLDFMQKIGLTDCKLDNGGVISGPLNKVPYMLIYNKDKIDRIVLRVHIPQDNPLSNDWAVYEGPLPGGITAKDSMDDVLRKLGEPGWRPSKNYMRFDSMHLAVSFIKETNTIEWIDIDDPERKYDDK